jgi:hypothetical protein
MISISVVNMIPNSWSGEQNQDCETGISFNPSNPNELVGTAFTFDNPAGSSAVSPAMSGAWAPVYYSTDGGSTWSLQKTLPSGAGAVLPTFDVTVRFSGDAQMIYSGLIDAASNSIVINRATNPTTQMTTLVTRSGDQPFVEAITSGGNDKVYVGYNDSGGSGATIDQSLDAATAAPPAGFNQVTPPPDARNSSAGPKVRVAIHSSGTVYAAFYSQNSDGTFDVVVVKDLNWGGSSPAYNALTDSGDHKKGVRVATSINADPSGTEDADFGNDRRGWELAIAVDPNNADRVYIVYSDGTTAANYTLHVRRSTDGGQTWLADSRTIVKAKNPGLAINDDGDVGFLYQQVVGATGSSSWVTIFEQTSDDFGSQTSHTLCTTPSSTPSPATDMATYIGDYAKLQASGRDFFGTFAADNTPDTVNFPSGITYQRNADWTTKQLLNTDNTTPVSVSIDPFFFSVVVQDLVITTDRSTFGQDEVNALIKAANPGGPPNPNPGVVSNAFYVVVDGFHASDLGITNATLTGTPDIVPTIAFSPTLSEITFKATSCQAEGGSLVSGRQRFTWRFELDFSGTADFAAEDTPVTMSASITSTGGTTVNGQAVLTLTTQPNPYEIDGPTWWVSVDLQVFRLLDGGALPNTPGIVLDAGPNDFIKRLLANTGGGYNDPTLPRAPNHPFDRDLVANGDTATVDVSGTIGGTAVYNFAVARVRYRALATPASNVRTFFRSFQAATTSTNYDPTTTYLNGGTSSNPVPILGLVNNEVVTIPFFADPRVDPTGSTGLNAQTDPTNVGPVGEAIPPDASGNEVQVYFGCWLDINQSTATMPPAGSASTGASPYTPTRSVQDLIRGQHTCLVAEIFLEPPEPQIATGISPANSDKLAQRNLTIVDVASPNQAPTTFDIKATLLEIAPSDTPDELMIDWGSLPAGSQASIYLPAASADEILALAGRLYRHHDLSRSDAHTIQCLAQGLTYVPLPAADSNYAGLLTVEVTEGVERQAVSSVVVRQVRNVTAPLPVPPPPPPELQSSRRRASAAAVPAPATAATVGARALIQWREVIGSFQLTIPVSTKAVLLPAEERLLSVMRWIFRSIPRHDRWHPVFHRYLSLLAGRVSALGGDPSDIIPSPTGEGRHEPRPPEREGERELCFTGKIIGLIFDHFGDFEGFTLDTEDGPRRFRSRETHVRDLVERAWRERLRLTVCAERARSRPTSITIHEPPAPLRRE